MDGDYYEWEITLDAQATIMEIILEDFLMFHQTFFSPKVKPGVIISDKQSL